MLRHLQLRHLILPLLLVPLAARAEDAPAKPLPRVLLVPYRVDARIPVDAETANAILVARMTAVKTVSIISQDELNRMGGYQSMLQGLGQDDVEGLKRLGEAADADLLINGTLGDVGGTATATLVLLNVRTGEVDKRIAGTARGGRDLVIPLLTGQADGMLAHLLRTYTPEKLGTRHVDPVLAEKAAPARNPLPGVLSTALVGAGALVAGLGIGSAATWAGGSMFTLLALYGTTGGSSSSSSQASYPENPWSPYGSFGPLPYLGVVAVLVVGSTLVAFAGAGIFAAGVVYRSVLE